MKHSFLILGGDRRSAFLYKALQEMGMRALLFAPAVPCDEVFAGSLPEAAALCDCIILPTPIFRADGFLNAAGSIPADGTLAELFAGKKVFVSGKEKLLLKAPQWKALKLYDFADDPFFKERNAVPSAEGALAEAILRYPGVIRGTKTLVAGYGAIGKALCAMLSSLGAEVTSSTRRKEDLQSGREAGIFMIETAALRKGGQWQLVFNTIPALVFTEAALSALPQGALVLDLASAPGGVDFKAAERLGMEAVLLPGLPGKYAPKAAGEIIAQAVLHLLEGEEND